MSGVEESVSSSPRTQRVVSLPCGHQLHVSLDASLLAVSGPVLDHQSTCRPERPPTFAAWFSVVPLCKGQSDALAARPPMPENLVA